MGHEEGAAVVYGGLDVAGQGAVDALWREGTWQGACGAGRGCRGRILVDRRGGVDRRGATAMAVRAQGQQRVPFHRPARRAFPIITGGDSRVPGQRGPLGPAACRLPLDGRCRALHLAVAGHGRATRATRGARELEEPALRRVTHGGRDKTYCAKWATRKTSRKGGVDWNVAGVGRGESIWTGGGRGMGRDRCVYT